MFLKWQGDGINYLMHDFLFTFVLAKVSGRGKAWLENSLLLLVS